MESLIKSIISVMGILIGIAVFLYGCFLLTKWFGFIMLGLILYWLFSLMGGE